MIKNIRIIDLSVVGAMQWKKDFGITYRISL